MKRFCTLLLLFSITLFGYSAFAGEHRIGVGANYWTAIDDIDFDDVDDDGFSFIGSYQYFPGGLFYFEGDLEVLPDKFGESAYAPQAFVLVGRSIYGGAGVGIEYRDSDFADEPFFAFRAGLNLELLPGIYADIYGIYRFNDSAQMENEATDIDSDTIFMGAAVRLAL